MNTPPATNQRPVMGQTTVKLPFGGRASSNPAEVRPVRAARVFLLAALILIVVVHHNVAGVDDVPGLPIAGDSHVGMGGLETHIRNALNGVDTRDVDEVKDAFMTAYRNAGRVDLEKLVEKWFDLHKR